MKKYIFFLFLICVSIYISLRHFSEEALVLCVGSECNYPPNNWEEVKSSDSNVPISNKEGFYAEGYDIQIAKLVAEKMGAKLEVKKISWQYLIEALNKREIDVIFSGMLDTTIRKQTISFSDFYDIHSASYNIIVRRDGKYAGAKTLKDFIGARFMTPQNTKLDWAAAQIKGAIRLPPAPNIQEIFEKLKKNDIDATIIDSDMARTYERVFPDFMSVKFSEGEGFKFDFTGICAGVRKGDIKLQKKINDALQSISKRERQRIMDQTILKTWNNL